MLKTELSSRTVNYRGDPASLFVLSVQQKYTKQFNKCRNLNVCGSKGRKWLVHFSDD